MGKIMKKRSSSDFGLINKLSTMSLLAAMSAYSHASCNSNITHTAPDSQYELLNNNTEVKDKQTGLIWQRCNLGQTWIDTSCAGSVFSYSWDGALQTAKSMGNGWRVPNIKELLSLVEEACTKPSINEVLFPGTINMGYWTSSPVSKDGYGGLAWLVDFGDGITFAYVKYGGYYVRLVRSDR